MAAVHLCILAEGDLDRRGLPVCSLKEDEGISRQQAGDSGVWLLVCQDQCIQAN